MVSEYNFVYTIINVLARVCLVRLLSLQSDKAQVKRFSENHN